MLEILISDIESLTLETSPIIHIPLHSNGPARATTMSGSNTEKVQENLKKFSAENIDTYIQASTFTDDIQDVIPPFPYDIAKQQLTLSGHSSTYPGRVQGMVLLP
jgi:hypothetical protein